MRIPKYLFHGTNSVRAKRIDREGLRTGRKKRWSRGNRRYVYLSQHPDIARVWGCLDRKDIESVVYWVDSRKLDQARLELDPADESKTCLRYRGRIPLDAIERVVFKETATKVVMQVSPEVAARLPERFEPLGLVFED